MERKVKEKIKDKVAINIKWLPLPEDHNYPAADSYLSLMFDPKTVTGLINELKKVKMTSFKAKDIFRAADLSLLGVSNAHLEIDQ